ncbi:class I SAM-dependent methyltransferase [Caenispirillum salinarum]|uniref:class I SAM-dependent methyltransferase n=1 Tax=Caenispirillum salinarum TaxID=859058 RepID=UPI00384D039C
MTAPAAADTPAPSSAPEPPSGGFSTDWLSLREPLDLEARPVALVQRLASRLPTGRPLTIVDLGCGTGSNLRALAPTLDARQTWHVIDNDPVLLSDLAHRIRPWAENQGLVQRWENADETVLSLDDEAERFRYRIVLEVQDLAETVSSLNFSGHDLVTSAALMDLVSREWVKTLVDHVVGAGALTYFALTYNGEMRWTPVDPMDDEILALFNRHQRGDKGFGPAMGPDAPQVMADLFTAAGYSVTTEPSDWDAAPDARGFQRTMARGIAAAAAELAPSEKQPRVRQWLDRRLQAIEDGHSRLRVGHGDLLAHP